MVVDGPAPVAVRVPRSQKTAPTVVAPGFPPLCIRRVRNQLTRVLPLTRPPAVDDASRRCWWALPLEFHERLRRKVVVDTGVDPFSTHETS